MVFITPDHKCVADMYSSDLRCRPQQSQALQCIVGEVSPDTEIGENTTIAGFSPKLTDPIESLIDPIQATIAQSLFTLCSKGASAFVVIDLQLLHTGTLTMANMSVPECCGRMPGTWKQFT